MTLVTAALLVSLAAQGNALPFGQPPRTRVVRYGDDRLVGITAVDVVVQLAADATRCGLEQEPLGAVGVGALGGPALTATYSAKNSSWFYTVFINLTSTVVGAQCVTGVATRLAAQVDGAPEADQFTPPGQWGSLLIGSLPLIESSGTVVSSTPVHASRVSEVVKSQLTEITHRIQRANARKAGQ